ncbi:DNA polymerase III subunit chi [Sphingomicrobium lutaoense]|uniref:DNA polymerase-3 subunit chi n=1 Tax=Sphingomicrobium lutaoense TaxID=515949 RepID=A0A839Z4N5_9SPHN|nr:DNA polymerase III subunit chi [Sphingomicrobium lutaoense]MBB3763614.1 DNA polymerase-3 subunit chi [Sphingomicrobium lutaoense]
MRVDFYQLADQGARISVLAALAAKLAEEQERLLVVAEDEGLLASLDRQLWEAGKATSFLAHGREGGPDDKRQPVLLSTRTTAPNLARNILIADGQWREAALKYDRAFYLFGEETLGGAREAWKALGLTSDAERHYWAQEEGRWVEKG